MAASTALSCKNVAEPVRKDASGQSAASQKLRETFLNGMNAAWIKYGRDLTEFDELAFASMLDSIASAGGNAVRWWIHVNGSTTPLYDQGTGKVSGMPEVAIVNLERALDLAYERNMLIIPCLWSFDMLQDQWGVNRMRNKKLITDSEYTQAYIDQALTPILEAVGTHPAVFAWEVCNEPEGMTNEFGWSTDRVSMKEVQAFVNRIAGAVHRFDPSIAVTNGSWSFRVLTDVDGNINWYRDDRLTAAGGDPLGTLDFYSVHFYQQHFGDALSPFHNAASDWELDKPIVVAEFAAKGIVNLGGANAGFKPSSTLTPEQAYVRLYQSGYAGALSWTYSNHDGFGGVSDAAAGIRAVSVLLDD
jgi:hypothetical protein